MRGLGRPVAETRSRPIDAEPTTPKRRTAGLAFLFACGLAIAGAGTVTLSAKLGYLDVRDRHLLEILPHLAWLTAAACALLALLLLRGVRRTLAVAGLSMLASCSFIGIVVLPAIDVPVFPLVEEVARSPAYGGDLIGLCIIRPDRPSQVAVCREVKLFPGVRWRRRLFQAGPADQVEFTRRSKHRYRCDFPSYGPGQQARSRSIYLHR